MERNFNGTRNKSECITSRSEIAAEDTWRLEDIFATEEDWEAAFKAVKEDLKKAEGHKGTLGESAEKLFSALQLQDEVFEKLGKVYSYSHMRNDQDTTNPFIKGWKIGQKLYTPRQRLRFHIWFLSY